MQDNFEEVIELVYQNIHKFITSKLGENLSEDDIAIDIEKDEKGEVHFSLELMVESLPYSRLDIQKIVDEAISIGKKIADEHCPSFLVKEKRVKKNK
ncbi:MAG: hypothetical protein ACTSW1_05120 [Candidatus Hodarchaeales archaeon]